jgi:hypothetical protein
MHSIVIYLQIKKNSLQMDASHRTILLPSVPKRMHFPLYQEYYSKTSFPSTLLNVKLVKYGPGNIFQFRDRFISFFPDFCDSWSRNRSVLNGMFRRIKSLKTQLFSSVYIK